MEAIAIYNTKNMTKTEWLDKRRIGIGGSDVGAIIGVNPYKTPLDVYLDKITPAERKEQSEAAYWGNTLEDIVAKEFAKRTGKKVQKCNSILRHPDYDFMIANVDRMVVGERAILECKTANSYFTKEWENDEVPASYLYQLHHYLAVTGCEKAYIAVLIGGQKFTYKEVLRDDEIIESIIKIESDFWENNVEKQVPPLYRIIPSKEALARLYPDENGTEIIMDEETENNVRLLFQVKSSIKELKGQQDQLENKIKRFMGKSPLAVGSECIATWRSQTSRRINVTKLWEEQPQIADKYSTLSKTRVLRIKEVK